MGKPVATFMVLLVGALYASGCSSHVNMYTRNGSSLSTTPLKEGYGVIVFVCHTQNFEQPGGPLRILPKFHKNRAFLPYSPYCKEWQVFEEELHVDHAESWQIFTIQVPAATYNLGGYTVGIFSNGGLWEFLERRGPLTPRMWPATSNDFVVPPGQYVYAGHLEFAALKSDASGVSKFLFGKYGPVEVSWSRRFEEDMSLIREKIPPMKDVHVVDVDLKVDVGKSEERATSTY